MNNLHIQNNKGYLCVAYQQHTTNENNTKIKKLSNTQTQTTKHTFTQIKAKMILSKSINQTNKQKTALILQYNANAQLSSNYDFNTS